MIKRLLIPLWDDEAGFVLSAELILITTVVVLGLTVAMVSVRNALAGELTDLSQAFRQIDQSYGYGGVRGCCTSAGWSSWTAGSKFLDQKLREPGSERDLFVEDLVLGAKCASVNQTGTSGAAIVHPACPAPCGEPDCPHPECHLSGELPPAGLKSQPLPPSEILGASGASFPILPVPEGAANLPCPDCPQSGLPQRLPTPSSDIPPQSRRVPFHGEYPYFSPIPKMIAGPLQVW